MKNKTESLSETETQTLKQRYDEADATLFGGTNGEKESYPVLILGPQRTSDSLIVPRIGRTATSDFCHVHEQTVVNLASVFDDGERHFYKPDSQIDQVLSQYPGYKDGWRLKPYKYYLMAGRDGRKAERRVVIALGQKMWNEFHKFLKNMTKDERDELFLGDLTSPVRIRTMKGYDPDITRHNDTVRVHKVGAIQAIDESLEIKSVTTEVLRKLDAHLRVKTGG